MEALDTVGAEKIICNKLSFACPEDIDQSIFNEFISNRGYSQEVGQVLEIMHRCPKFTFTNKRQAVPVEIYPKLNREKFWAAKYKEQNVPSKVSTSITSKTATSSLSKDSKSALEQMDKKLQEALCNQQSVTMKSLAK